MKFKLMSKHYSEIVYQILNYCTKNPVVCNSVGLELNVN